ncbi:MAG: DUF222 domain-containing protein [Pseudonocardia sp.]|nr:DUF222 domain-containing protein [Pseudonocardia sp.]
MLLDDVEVVDEIVALEHLASWAAARQARLTAEFVRRRPGDDPALVGGDKACSMSSYAPDELALALSQSRYSAKARIGQAVQLTEVLTDTLAAWETGRLDGGKVRAICDATHRLPVEVAVAIQDRVLTKAPQQSLAQLKAALRRAVIAADPEGAAERHRKARTERRVCVGDENDGMASIWALLPADVAVASHQWLSRLARGLGTQDPRGMDARRADLMGALLTGKLTVVADNADATTVTGTPDASTPDASQSGSSQSGGDPGVGGLVLRPVSPGKPLVQVVMPYSTLRGLDDQPCELVGYGPIPADLAREIAADAVWRRLVTDPLSGAVLDYGRDTYRPSAALSDFVKARDVYCRFPVCRRRAQDSELDHTIPFPEGPTADHNLADGCTRHHHLKHDAIWTVVQHPDGRVTWTTPTGHSYTSDPHDYRPEPEPAPRPAAKPKPEPPAPKAGPARLQNPWGPVTDRFDDPDPPPF